MAGKTPNLAVKAFVGPIQKALTCFVDGKVTADSYDPEKIGVLTFNRGDPTRLKGPDKIHIQLSMNYAIIPSGDEQKPWKAHTTGYIYKILRGGDALVDYHWHPVATPDFLFPHLHMSEFGVKRHYPTGRVLIEDVLTLAVEIGAQPRNTAKWEKVLATNVKNFAKGATWGTAHPSLPVN